MSNGEYLLDTHVWLWSLLEPARLRKRTREVLRSATVWLSPISTWEATLLIERKRLEVDASTSQWVEEAIDACGAREAALNHRVAIQSRRVQMSHDDPADRFLAASAAVYELTLLTADARLLGGKGYRVAKA